MDILQEISLVFISVMASFALALILGKIFIPLLHRMKFGQPVRDDGPQTHLKKQGTPTMGGMFIAIAMVIACLIFSGKCSEELWAMMAASLLFAVIGLIDDLKKIREHNSKGIRAWQKIALQLIFGSLCAVYAYMNYGSDIYIPFLGKTVEMGWAFIPFCVVFMIAFTNSVNLTDGLDGLAASVTGINALYYALMFILFASVGHNTDGSIFSGILLGSIMGYLIYNSYPSKVMMGDVGSFLLGGALSSLAIISKTELLVPISGIMFVLSSVSVILQVGSYKLRHKRIFKMAPLHHHFELMGYSETNIVTAYTVITGIAVMAALLWIK
ncbi:MAG: phospho-N-acetylmuramoyl-pentapeptide-transferase [Clostridia bacterium]|jgi:phospho-N-acetylmuramoyl-pentapeptide-transferase|nr:phospho-N-acetylmuramoyl-pentapeptide-transferase [Clostridia bacterium]MBQ5956963.1 phospho-N-acetylmuramoyl-pentapeptide-transferase [Clostridia bacterium]MBR3564642.1 phospho-N-acetylmuramoyl-pentapeptide-transferase [Clostridia bacterium]MBR6136041.1 phospho-N-acetylmuramoyl-pentapeptide-transferase [Clostridia bacterium]MBR6822132.1 phospho-N-acetylmuramoyl-pentapeptide-transferase [Clostridia bacterium]